MDDQRMFKTKTDDLDGFWQEADEIAPHIWKITCAVAVIGMGMALTADLNNLKPEHLRAGIIIRLIGIAYFLVTGLIAFFNADFIKKWYPTLMVSVIGIVSTVSGIIGAWSGNIDNLYFTGVLEAEFAAVMFFTISRKTLIPGVIVSNLLYLASHIYLGNAPINVPFLNVALVLAICALIAAVAHHIILSYKEDSFLQRRRLAVSQQKIKNILSSITDSFFALDNSWRFIYFNPQAERRFLKMNRTKDDLIEKNIWEEFPWLQNSMSGKEFIRSKEGNIPLTFEEYFPMMDTHMEVHAYPSPDGISVYMNDITGRKRAEEALHRSLETLEQRVAERTAELRRLAVHLESIREDERTRISREIHDQIGQTLVVFKMELAWLNSRLQNSGGDIGRRMKTMLELLQETIDNVRQITAELRPGILDDLGLAAAVEWLAERIQERHGIACAYAVEPPDLLLDPDRSTAVFRILQESLANVVRHAEASKVEILLHQTDDHIILKVKDNGTGIRLDTGKPRKGGLGLVGMRERARLFDGLFEVSGEPGLGTTVTVQIPCPLPVPRTET